MNASEILAIRKKMGLSQEDFAAKIGVSFMTVSRWERGISNPLRLAENKLAEIARELSLHNISNPLEIIPKNNPKKSSPKRSKHFQNKSKGGDYGSR